MKKYGKLGSNSKELTNQQAPGPSAMQAESSQDSLAGGFQPAVDDQKISSVVKIFTTSKEADYASPWAGSNISECSGTGFIIEGQRIVTNGHVVANQVFMKVQIAGKSERFTARLLHHADQCDLAILTVDSPEFWQQVHINELGKLPSLRSRIGVYGFPVGGSELSITEGIISRIDFDQYAHSEEELLVVQVDAAINPGNSGGPVFHDDKVVGIVHQGMDGGQNLGYFIPVNLLKNVLSQIDEFGHYKGLVDFDIKTQSLENPHLRKMAGLSENESGLMVKNIPESSALSNFLQPRDVLMRVDKYTLSNVGTVNRFASNLSYRHLFHEKKPGDLINVTIKRDSKLMNILLPLQSIIGEHRLVPPVQHNKKPSYVIYGGLIFTPLTTNYIQESFGGFFDSTPSHLKVYEKVGVSNNKKQVVLLSGLLNNTDIEGYDDVDDRVVQKVQFTKEIQGQKEEKTEELVDIYHLATLLADPYVTNYVFHLDNLNLIAIEKLTAQRHKEILDTYDINDDRSADVRTCVDWPFALGEGHDLAGENHEEQEGEELGSQDSYSMEDDGEQRQNLGSEGSEGTDQSQEMEADQHSQLFMQGSQPITTPCAAPVNFSQPSNKGKKRVKVN